ncbi:MAG: phosphoribosylglycinamide formyltransferase [Chitinophagales bacterium]|nr:phosphoribosylglycinamide formyltransferase [Chitinophagales bacterium]
MKNLAVFASGAGTNAEAIIRYFDKHASVSVSLVVTNNPASPVIAMAHRHRIISAIISNKFLQDAPRMGALLQSQSVDFIALAGFLQRIPEWMVRQYSERMVNIHPALLPRFGGKGMYGIHVHKAVLEAGEKETGITIHLVNEQYDEGKIIEQHKIPIAPDDTPDTLSAKVRELEHRHYPPAIEALMLRV